MIAITTILQYYNKRNDYVIKMNEILNMTYSFLWVNNHCLPIIIIFILIFYCILKKTVNTFYVFLFDKYSSHNQYNSISPLRSLPINHIYLPLRHSSSDYEITEIKNK